MVDRILTLQVGKKIFEKLQAGKDEGMLPTLNQLPSKARRLVQTLEGEGNVVIGINVRLNFGVRRNSIGDEFEIIDIPAGVDGSAPLDVYPQKGMILSG